jgi:signal transduction histidine kinase
MKRGLFLLAIAGGLVIAAVSFAGFMNLRFRPDLPIPGGRSQPTLRVLRIDDWEIRLPDEIDFVLSRKKIGDPVAIEIEKNGRREIVRTVLVPYYSRSNFPLIFGLTGAFGFLIGFLVFALRSGDERAHIFYAMTLAFSASVVISGDCYGIHDRGLSLIPGVLFNFAYPLAPALLLRFAATFSPRRMNPRLRLLWSIPVTIGALLNIGFLVSQLRPSLSAFRSMLAGFVFFRWYVAALCALAGVILVLAFRAARTREVRAQVKWVFSGICGGLFLYIFFYQVPMAAVGVPWLSEDLTSAFFILMPLAMAVAILKFRLMDIDIVINRSIVYSILTVATVGVYLVCVEVLGRLLARVTAAGRGWISLVGVVLAAAAFEPGRKKIQLAVDKTFFRQTHDYRKAVRSFNARALNLPSPEILVSLFAETVVSALPLEKIGVLACGSGTAGIAPMTALGVNSGAANVLMAETPPDRAWARIESVRAPHGLDFARPDLLEKAGFEIILPISFAPDGLRGYIGLGRKKSGGRFTEEDLDLVSALGSELASGLRRIRLQEEVAFERASREKADELVRLKTEFVSSVSHELRSPMSSIRNLAELLQSGRIGDESKRERLLGLMAGECGRLSRFLGNVLDFGKIEQDTRTYDLRPVPVQPAVEEVLEFVRSDRGEAGTAIRTEMPGDPVFIDGDPDALRQALWNLVDNAFVYGGGRGEVTIRVLDGGNETEIQVEDQGIGIEPGDQEKIFHAFFRSPGGVKSNPKGAGLGLKIVKHIMDAHAGRVSLRSEPGRGSVFSLIFPKRRTQ